MNIHVSDRWCIILACPSSISLANQREPIAYKGGISVLLCILVGQSLRYGSEGGEDRLTAARRHQDDGTGESAEERVDSHRDRGN